MQKIFSLFLSFLLLVVCVPGDSYAQRQAQTFGAAKPLPDIPFMSDDEFKSQTKLVRNKSPEDTFLAYEIRVPKSWTEVQQGSGSTDVSLKLFNSLSVYESPIGEYNKKSILQ
ncbi:MAG: hypothetical protein AAF182_04140, partial [Pseudomonadota bacterium]